VRLLRFLPRLPLPGIFHVICSGVNAGVRGQIGVAETVEDRTGFDILREMVGNEYLRRDTLTE
jgi:hypothetical protein